MAITKPISMVLRTLTRLSVYACRGPGGQWQNPFSPGGLATDVSALDTGLAVL
jgi:hypothetical protein